jgi:hypothetical protein
MTSARIYEVFEHDSSTSMLIRAVSPHQARSFVARKAFKVSVASSDRVAELAFEKLVTEVQDATKEAEGAAND